VLREPDEKSNYCAESNLSSANSYVMTTDPVISW